MKLNDEDRARLLEVIDTMLQHPTSSVNFSRGVKEVAPVPDAKGQLWAAYEVTGASTVSISINGGAANMTMVDKIARKVHGAIITSQGSTTLENIRKAVQEAIESEGATIEPKKEQTAADFRVTSKE